MKHLLSLSLLFAAVSLFANAGVFMGSGQNVVLDSTAQIQMAEEVVTMRPMRGDYPVDGSCRNMDPMQFHCVFKLRNLTDQEVTVPVGFPISAEAMRFRAGEDAVNQAEVVSFFHFVAGTKDRTYAVRYVPFDKKKKFSNIFLWDMTFKPKEEIELIVSYTMYGYLGLTHTQKGKIWDLDGFGREKHSFLRIFEHAAGEGHSYVTETGKSWAGKIEKAVFRITPFHFEEYLAKRRAFEENPKLRAALKNDKAGGRSEKDRVLEILRLAPMLRKWSPAYDKWKLVKDNRGEDLYLELVYEPFEPKSEADNLEFWYLFPVMPTTAQHFDALLAHVKEEMDMTYAQRDKMLKFWEDAEKNKTRSSEQIKGAREHWTNQQPYSPAVERLLADAVLEFYGIRRNNPELKEFLERQCWYPAPSRPIDPELKERLLRAGTTEAPSGETRK